MIPIEGNIIVATCFDSFEDSQSRVAGRAAESAEMSFASYSSDDDYETRASASLDSSGYDSISMASSSSSSTGKQKNTYDTSISPELLGAEQPVYRRNSRSPTSKLTEQLVCLPGASAYERSNKKTLFRSYASAPPIMQHSSKSIHEYRDEKSVKSARSASSSESEPSTQRDESNSVSLPHRASGASGTPRNGHTAIKDSTSKSETAQQFHDNWLESKMRALDDAEVRSVADVFQVDIQSHAFVDESQSGTSGLSSAVSDFMKSIRVVGSAADTESSAEHSSIELRSLYSNKENNSTDISLEQSRAASLSEI
jgi:hypothetical protein